MSSPGQIADPRARPQSGMPGNYTPYQPDSMPRHTPMKEYGQEYQFAESWANPLPELVVGSPASPTAAAGVPQADGIQEHTGNDGFGRGNNMNIKESVWVPPPEKPWYKKIHKKWWIAGAITVVGITGVIMAILAGMNTFGDHSSSVSPSASSSVIPSAMLTASRLPAAASSTTSSSSLGSTPTATSITSSIRPTPTANLIKDCSRKDSYHTNIEWMGGIGGSSKFASTNSAEACCRECFDGNPGCAGWLYNGTNIWTPCTKFMIDGQTSGGDAKCPAGYTKTSFTKGGDTIAGIGPCADSVGGD